MASDPERSLEWAKRMCFIVGILAILFGSLELMAYLPAHNMYADAVEQVKKTPGAKLKADAHDAPMSQLVYGAGFVLTGLAMFVFGLLLAKGLAFAALGGLGVCGINIFLAIAAIAQGVMGKDFRQVLEAVIVLVPSAIGALMLLKSRAALADDTGGVVPGSSRMTGYADKPSAKVPAVVRPATGARPAGAGTKPAAGGAKPVAKPSSGQPPRRQ